MTPVTQALSAALLHFVWQGIAGGLLLAIALHLLRKSSPNSRYVASCVVLALLALAPVATGWLSYASASPGVDLASTIVSGSSREEVVNGAAGRIAAVPLRDFEGWILPLWASGVMAFALRLAWAGGHASSLRRHGVEAGAAMRSVVETVAERVGVRRAVRVLISSLAEVPSVVGWLRPVILLPVAVVAGLTPQQVEALIAHELAHVRRYDYLVNILQMVIETLLFYHPAVWWTSSRIRYERELCCDDLAVRACGDAISYARALTQLEKLRPAAPTLAMGSAGGPLLHRVQRLIGHAGTEKGPSRLACAVGLVVGVLCLGLFLQGAGAQQEIPTAAPSIEPILPVAPVPPSPLVSEPVTAPVPQSTQQLPPAPPAPPVPPLPPPDQVGPLAPLPPAPPPPPPLPPGLALADDSHWVLFRGTDLIVHGSASDEEEARKTRSSLSGDLLWFQLDGKPYVSQDTQILAGIQLNSADSPGALGVLLAATEQSKKAYDNGLLIQRAGDIQQLIQQLEELSRKIDRGPADVQQSLNETRREMMNIAATNARLRTEVQNAARDLQIARRNADMARRGNLDLLRDAVRSGRAQATP